MSQLDNIARLEDLLQVLESTIDDHENEIASGGQVYTDYDALLRVRGHVLFMIQETQS